MKKFSIILFALLNICGCTRLNNPMQKQMFVNPIFSKPLLAYGRTSWNTILTPNRITVSPDDFSNPEAYIEKYDCELLENKQTHVKYSCNVCHQYLLELGLDTKENTCYPNIIIYKITDNGLVKKTSFNPKRPNFGSEVYLKASP